MVSVILIGSSLIESPRLLSGAGFDREYESFARSSDCDTIAGIYWNRPEGKIPARSRRSSLHHSIRFAQSERDISKKMNRGLYSPVICHFLTWIGFRPSG